MEAETLSLLDGVPSNSCPIPYVKKEEIESETDVTSRYTFDCSIVKDEYDSCEYKPLESILSSIDDCEDVKVEDTNSSNNPDCNAESNTNTIEPFKFCVIDDDNGTVLETFVQENGVLKPYVPQLNQSKIKTQKKRPIKNRRIKQISLKTDQVSKKKYKKSCVKRDEVLKNKLYSCKLCDSEFEGRKLYRRHLYQHIKTENNIHECCFCHYSTPERGHLNRHILQKHSYFKREKLFTCNTCGKRFFESKDLERHTFLHTQVGNLKCSFCNFSHVRKSIFEKHLHLNHSFPVEGQGHGDETYNFQHRKIDLYECDYCGYKCGEKRDIMLHIHRHLGLCKYTCDQCGYSCLQSSDLKKHLAIHSNERPFICSTCSKSFKRRSHLLIHLRGKKGCLK